MIDDEKYMRRCLQLAQNGHQNANAVGTEWPSECQTEPDGRCRDRVCRWTDYR